MRKKIDKLGWSEMIVDRITSEKPLCDECIDDLKTYFGKK